MENIYIEWCDATEKEYGWSSESEIKEWAETNNWIVKQFGFVVSENKECIVLATRYSPVENDQPLFGGVIKIPKTWIVKRDSINQDVESILKRFITDLSSSYGVDIETKAKYDF